MRSHLLATILILFTFFGLNAQTVNVNGTVTDETGEGMPSAAVVVNGTSTGTVTDINGKFSISAEVGQSVSIKFLGYREKSIAVEANSQNLTIQLELAQVGLDQVVVSASKRKERILDAPASVTVLNEAKLENTVAVTPVDHLKKVPGVDVMETGLVSSNVSVRGFNNIFSGAVLTMVDNRIARVPSLKVNAFQLIPTANDDVEKMEVVRGPGSALYGPNAADGVLHIVTKSPLDMEEDFETSISMAGGLGGVNPFESEASFWKPEIRHAGKIGDKFGYKISGSYMKGQDWEFYDPREPSPGDSIIFGSVIDGKIFQPDTIDGVDTNNDGTNDFYNINGGRFDRDFAIEKWNADVRLDYKITDDMVLTLNGGIARTSNIELTGLGGAQGINWIYSYGQLRYKWKDLFIQYFINSSDAGDTYLIPQVSGDDAGPYNIQRLVDKSKLHVVQAQHRSELLDDRLEMIYGTDILLTRPNTEGTINGRFEDNDDINQYGAYLQAEYDVNEQFTVVGAARGDYMQPIDEFMLSPRAALVYKPTQRHTIRGTYNRAFSSPSSLNLFLDLSNGRHPLFGYDLRAYGNPSGMFYDRGDNGLPLGYNFWTQQNFNYQDRSVNETAFRGYVDVLKQQFIATGQSPILVNLLFAAIFKGVYDSTGVIHQVDHAAIDFVAYLDSDPESAYANSLLDLELVEDLESVKSSITQTWELGYKGIIKDKFNLQIDGYYTRIENFTSPLNNVVPTIVFDPDDLTNIVWPVMEANLQDLTGALAGLDSSATFGGNFNGSPIDEVYRILMETNGQLGIGNVAPNSNNPNDPDIAQDVILTYVNLGTVDVLGADLGFTYLHDESFTVTGAFSWVNKDRIDLEGAAGGFIALNAPKFKSALSLDYIYEKHGIGGSAGWRWQDSYPANSAIYIGTVHAANFFDLGLTYQPTSLEGLRLAVDVSNVLNHKQQRFPGTPFIGRMISAKIKYKF